MLHQPLLLLLLQPDAVAAPTTAAAASDLDPAGIAASVSPAPASYGSVAAAPAGTAAATIIACVRLQGHKMAISGGGVHM